LSWIPSFLRRLGLDASADERAIRREYARILKTLDPETDPRGFQELREAYQAALGWARAAAARARAAEEARARRAEAAAKGEGADAGGTAGEDGEDDDEDEDDEDDDGAPPRGSAQIWLQATGGTQGPDPAREPPVRVFRPLPPLAPPGTRPQAPARPLQEALRLAEEVFEPFRDRVRTWPPDGSAAEDAKAQILLRDCLADPRMVSLEARRLFEQLVADLLVEPGLPARRPFLLGASKTFEWGRDRKRLERFGPSGRQLNEEIDRGAHQWGGGPPSDRNPKGKSRWWSRQAPPPAGKDGGSPKWLFLLIAMLVCGLTRTCLDAPDPARAQAQEQEQRLKQDEQLRIRDAWYLEHHLLPPGAPPRPGTGAPAGPPGPGGTRRQPAGRPDLPGPSRSGSLLSPRDQALLEGIGLQAQGDRALAQGNLGLAVDLYGKAIRATPTQAGAWRGRGLARLKRKEYPQAIQDFTEAIRLDPANWEPWFRRGYCRQEGRLDLDGAMADYGETLKRQPRNASALLNRGNLWWGRNDLDRAMADYDACLRADPRLAVGWANRGRLRLRQGDRAGAQSDFRQALQLDLSLAPQLPPGALEPEKAPGYAQPLKLDPPALRLDHQPFAPKNPTE
jgi:Tfp pilus assembly protein PilF